MEYAILSGSDTGLLKSRIETLIHELPATWSDDLMGTLGDLNDHCVAAIESEPDALLCCLFLNAIKDHYQPDGTNHGHLYLEKYEIPQIQLFDILINKFPFVATAHAISNSFIAGWVQGKSSVAILDVGIGRGIQMTSLLHELAGIEGLQKVTVIGIEPFADAIPFATQMITAASQGLPFSVDLHIIEGFAETTDVNQLRDALPADCDAFLINASLALHHIPTITQREQFFQTIKQLSPLGIVLTEPHTGHMTGNWKLRIKNAWTHYGAVFNTIDQIPVSEAEKRGLKMFFGREIKDVVGTLDEQRFERHETVDRWVAYGRNAGLHVQKSIPVPPTEPGSAIGILADENGIMMSRHNVPVLAIIPLVSENN